MASPEAPAESQDGSVPSGRLIGAPGTTSRQSLGSSTILRIDEPHDDIVRFALKSSPPWLISAIVHMVVVILLALLLLPQMFNDQVELQATFAETLGEQDLIDSNLANTFTDDVDKPVVAPDDLLEVLKPALDPSQIELELSEFAPSSGPLDANVGLAYDGRQAGRKEILLGRFGGTKTTQDAVQAGLAWLARNQQAGGSWSLVRPYSGPGKIENRQAATAMALLAFQGDGNTTEFGPYKNQVEQGWYYLLKQQDGEGCFFREGRHSHPFYTQGLATIALCELYAMTSDPALRASYREPAVKAIEYCVNGQSPEGGWRYSPRADSDLSVTGWILMALQSARMAGLDVPKETFVEASRYLDSVSEEGGSRYIYRPGRRVSRAITAEGLLCRQYLGWKPDNPELIDGVEWLLQPENQLSYTRNRDVYYWYYATQVMHHMEGEPWERWNRRMRELVPAAQVQKGREAGSWDPRRPTPDRRGKDGGRLYVTCLSIYMLEVYYRHLPLYSTPF